MKSITSKSTWSDIIEAAQEAKERYSTMLEEHPRIETNKQLFVNLELVANKQTLNKEQAAMFVNEVLNITYKSVAKASEMREEFLNSEEGKRLTREFEDKKNELYRRVVKINNEVIEKMNAHLAQHYNCNEYTLAVRDYPFLNRYKNSINIMLSTGGETNDILKLTFTHEDYDYTQHETVYPDRMTFDVQHAENEFEADSFAAYKYIAIGKIMSNANVITEYFRVLLLKGIYEVIDLQDKANELEYDYRQATTF